LPPADEEVAAPRDHSVPKVIQPAGDAVRVRAIALKHLASLPPLNAIRGPPALSGLRLRQEALCHNCHPFLPPCPAWAGLEPDVGRHRCAQPCPAPQQCLRRDPGPSAHGAPASLCWSWVHTWPRSSAFLSSCGRQMFWLFIQLHLAGKWQDFGHNSLCLNHVPNEQLSPLVNSQ